MYVFSLPLPSVTMHKCILNYFKIFARRSCLICGVDSPGHTPCPFPLLPHLVRAIGQLYVTGFAAVQKVPSLCPSLPLRQHSGSSPELLCLPGQVLCGHQQWLWLWAIYALAAPFHALLLCLLVPPDV